MNKIKITERALNSIDGGSIRIHPEFDHTNYGYWFPQEHMDKILSKEVIEELTTDYPPKTIDTEVTDEQLALIKEIGLNPYK